MIVITGGAGFIGSALVWGLNQRGVDNILVVDRLGASESWKNLVSLRFADFMDADDFLSQIQSSGRFASTIAGVLHLGACSSTTEPDMGFLQRNNTHYTQTLIRWAAENHKRLVYASSAATYGAGAEGFSDDHAGLARLRPLNGYAFSKQLVDLWALRNGYLDQVAGVKFFNVFGPNEYHKDDMRSLVHKACGQIRQTGKVRLFKSYRPDFKDGWQLRDFVYIKDAVNMTLFLYEHPGINGIFNVGTGQARGFYELAAATFAAMDRKVNIEMIEMPEVIRDKYQYFTEAKMDKLRAAGFTGQLHRLEDAVADYVKNYLLQDDPYLK